MAVIVSYNDDILDKDGNEVPKTTASTCLSAEPLGRPPALKGEDWQRRHDIAAGTA